MTVEDGGPALIVDFGGEVGTFAAHDRANQAVLVKYVDDLLGGGYAAVKAAVELSRDMVLPEDIERFDQFLLANGRAEDFTQSLYDALDACWRGETHLPLGSSPASSGTTSPTNGEPSSRDGSSSPATVDEQSDPSLAVA